MEQKLRRAAHKTENQSNMKTFLEKEGKALAIKAGLVVVLILFLVMIYGRDGANDVPLEDIKTSITENCTMEKMESCSDRDLMKFIGLNAEEYGDSFVYIKSNESLGVEELLILKTPSESKLDAAKDACESRIDSQINTFKGYGAEQCRMLGQATLFTKGDYLFYSVGDNSYEYEEVFRNAIQ